ncbi:MAG: UDP-N-acetylmuramoyl-tripeptide--D-alanyl-D-alanine ligase [Fimbriimonadaceae bacterium]|nr:UDP-N-acetylmuramoyl-tripeptide--D-alanyl-D-alanine ligase [Fimbriimonadaceae bacterium]
MNPIGAERFATIVHGRAVGFERGVAFYSFALDSREARPGCLFIAVRGERVDGHDFAASAFAAGAAGALVERAVEGPHILVDDVEEALAALGAHFRSQFHGPVVGVTGSAGKTTTKEFLAAALAPLGPVLRTEGNRNTQLTAPLVWAELLPTHRAAVIEMAMRGPGQIRHLCAFSRPTIGVITNIGTAHLEQLGSRAAIADAKGELVESLSEHGTAVLWHEDEFLEVLRGKASGDVVTFGTGEGATCRVTGYEALGTTRCAMHGVLDGTPFACELPTVGRHQALNAAAALLAANVAGVKVWEAAESLAQAKLPGMRMEPVMLGGATLMVDAYNANPAGMRAAISTLADLPCEGRRLAVIGEMKELGEGSEAAHRELGVWLADGGVASAVFVGEGARWAMEAFLDAGGSAVFAESLDDVAEFLQALLPGDLVLVKGSRALELEKAVAAAGGHA